MGHDKKIRIATIGDSLTQGNAPPNTRHPGVYQYFMKRWLKQEGIKAKVTNWGIGGQVAGEIATRVPHTLPTDILVMMGGTNDVWRFSNFDAETSADMCVDVLEQLALGARRARVGQGDGAKHLVVCSVPPFGKVKTLPKDAWHNLQKINAGIQNLCEKEGYTFSDVHAAMRLPDAYGNPKYLVQDGVHFTDSGRQACGEAIAKSIAQYIKLKN